MSTRAVERPRLLAWLLGGIGCFAVYVALFLAGGAFGEIALAGLEVLPFLLLALLAYLSLGHDWLRPVAAVWLAIMILSIVGLSFTYGLNALPEGDDSGALALVAGCVIGVAAGALCYLPSVRRLLARWLPLEPRSFIHATALALVVSVTMIEFVPLIVVGEPPLLVTIRAQGGGSEDDSLLVSIYGLLWIVPASVIAVGFPVARSLRAALVRLGFVRPTRRQVAFGVLAAAGMVLLFIFVDGAIARLWEAFGWTQTDGDAVGELFEADTSLLGAVVIGVTAGLGEELAVRGVLQPRLGILLPNLFFTALHALQYNFDGLLSVFIAGLIFGLIRRRTNTTTSAIVHGGYDFILVSLAALAVPGFS